MANLRRDEGANADLRHLKMTKFTQHFEDVLDFTKTPLQWFMDRYPETTREDARKWLGRYGTSGVVQQQTMSQLSEGQKAKVVFVIWPNNRTARCWTSRRMH